MERKMSKEQPSNWQQAISGEWHGCPSVFEPDGTYVGNNKVSRASEFEGDRTTYWMNTAFDCVGALAARFEMGPENMRFGVIDSDDDRIYCGPDFIGAGRPFGMLVDSNYFSPGWNTDLHTVNLVLPDRGLQVYSSLLYEGPTLIAAFNGIYCVTQDHDTNPETQKYVEDFLAREKQLGKRQYILPIKKSGRWVGTVEVYDPEQRPVGEATITIEHTPLTLLRSCVDVTIAGALERKYSCQRARVENHHTYEGPDVFGNGIAYGRYLYSVQHFHGEAYKLRSRETLLYDNDGALAIVWNFYKSGCEDYVLFGVLDWEAGDDVIEPQYK